ncbi:MAG: SRPBCC family protein [Myxococcales bacterium]|nr:SRPBCC family protein [Myxococcales bacterium]
MTHTLGASRAWCYVCAQERPEPMPAVEHSVEIAARREPLFALSQDYGLRRAWDPFVREMRFTGGATRAARGASVFVRAYNGLTMEVLFTVYEAPAVVAMKMTKGPAMFSRFAGSWRFTTVARGGRPVTRVHFRYGFETRWAALRWLLNPVVRAVLARDVRARLRALQRAVEREQVLQRLTTQTPATCGATG